MGDTTALNKVLREESFETVLERVLKDGEEVSTWRVVSLIGKGGNGEVYRVEHVRTGNIAALKILSNLDDIARDRFALESEVLQKMTLSKSPVANGNYPRLLDRGVYGEYQLPFVVTEHLNEFKLPRRDKAVAKFITTICKAISELHTNGYLHRDLKPGNIMCRDNGEPVIIDFGCALRLNDIKEDDISERVSLMMGSIQGVGTEGSTAPEQLLGKHLSPRSDVYAIGSLISDCFGGSVPMNWGPIVRKAIDPKPENRYANPDEMLDAIEARGKSDIWVYVARAATLVGLLYSCFMVYSTVIAPKLFGKSAEAPAPVVETPAPVPEAPAPVIVEKPAPVVAEVPAPVVVEAPAPKPAEAKILPEHFEARLTTQPTPGGLKFDVKLTPKGDLRVMPKDVFYLIDSTGSVGKTRIRSICEGVKTSLRGALNDGDRFNLANFNSDKPKLAFDGWQSADVASFGRADQWLGSIATFGPGNYLNALYPIMNGAHDGKRAFVILSITDESRGLSGQSFGCDASLFVYSPKRIGGRVSEFARANGGEAFGYTGTTALCGSQIETFARTFKSPVLTGVEVAFASDCAAENVSGVAKTVFRGVDYSISGSLPADARVVSFTLRGVGADGEIVETVKLPIEGR